MRFATITLDHQQIQDRPTLENDATSRRVELVRRHSYE
jgi:hypothetical protein